MALHIPKAPGYASMLKDGARHYEGLEETVYRSIEACVALAKTTSTTYGPQGQSKIVINHIGKQFVTKDVATILKELEVAHPAAKMLVLATQQQEQEVGDGTNLVFQLAGSLLQHASDLLRMGLSVSQVADGFELAATHAQEILHDLVIERLADIKDHNSVKRVIHTAISSKQVEYADFLSELITTACIYVLPKASHFNVDNIRVVKVIGSGVFQSHMVKGMVFHREAEGVIKEVEKAKVVVYSCPFDSLQTETKGTVLINTADELTNLTKGEEEQMEKKVKELVAAGIKVVITGGKVGELALHYANIAKLMIVRLPSKFDIRRVSQITGATPLPGLICPSPEEMGYIGKIKCDYIADTKIVILEEPQSESSIATIVLRGSTESMMDDIERCVDDGVNAFKCLTRCNKLVAGGGAFEIELQRKLMDYADKIPSLEQYAIREYSKALEIIPKALAENGGMKATEAIAQISSQHHSGAVNTGIVTLPNKEAAILDSYKHGVVDIMAVKQWALKFSCAAACTVIRVDQLIMAKPAGGPKPRDPKAMDEDD